jgi:uncharacterized protein YcbK (DUF882 family)
VGAAAALARLAHPPIALASDGAGGALRLYNIHTAERLQVTYRDASGRYDAGALRALNHLLRCHATGEVAEMDLAVIEFVNLVDQRLGRGHEFHIISGYRSSEYNARLLRRGGVVRHSLHLVGRAIDIRIPGVDLRTVRQTALSLAYGGVGYYPRSSFVHLDSGPLRSW